MYRGSACGKSGSKPSSGARAATGVQRAGRQRCVAAYGTASELSGLGLEIPADRVSMKRLVGEGSFGEVFEGTVANGVPRQIIMKRIKPSVVGAEQMSENEHVLNVYVQKNAAGSCAEFLGYTVADEASIGDRRLKPGKWLLWEFQGLKTLSEYLRKKDCLAALARDLRVPESAAIPIVIRHLLECLQKLHSLGLVHRDVKPANVIFCEEDRYFRLIDLGAVADLRTGVNYRPDESILDPYYCPPEQYVLPTDTVDLANTNRMLSLAMSAMLWNRHKPDRFDLYSVGLILLQLTMPHLRGRTPLKGFHETFKRCRYDLGRWRTISTLTAQHTALLDANGGAGWELAEALLRPRAVQVLADGHVYFTNEGKQRPSAAAALQYRFLEPAFQTTQTKIPAMSSAAAATTVAAAASNGAEDEAGAGLFGMFRRIQRRLTQLEDDIVETAAAAEEQTSTVLKLRQQAARGEVAEEELERAEGVLAKMTGSLEYLQAELDATMDAAQKAFQEGMEGTKQVGGDAASRKKLAEDLGISQTEGVQAVGLAGMVSFAFKNMGRAVKATGKLVKNVNTGAVAALERYRLAQGDLSEVEMEYMNMLQEGNVSVSSRWADVQAKFSRDPRFLAVVGEQKLILFRSYIGMLQDIDGMRLSDAEREFMRQLTYRVTKSDTISWRGLQSIWKDEACFQAVGESAAEVLFVRHIARLQRSEAQQRRDSANEIAYRAMLENMSPPITRSTLWSEIAAQVNTDRRYANVHVLRKKAIFEEVRGSVAEPEPAEVVIGGGPTRLEVGLNGSQSEASELRHDAAAASSNGASARAGNGSVSEDEDDAGQGAALRSTDEEDQAALAALRREQKKLQEEYARMEERLREMEDRLRVK